MDCNNAILGIWSFRKIKKLSRFSIKLEETGTNVIQFSCWLICYLVEFIWQVSKNSFLQWHQTPKPASQRNKSAFIFKCLCYQIPLTKLIFCYALRRAYWKSGTRGHFIDILSAWNQLHAVHVRSDLRLESTTATLFQ